MNPTPAAAAQPVLGVGGVVLLDGRAALVRRGKPPLEGRWSIPGGRVEAGETLAEALVREMLEETSLRVRPRALLEVVEPISRDAAGRLEYHYVVLDYACELLEGTPRAGGDVTEIALAGEEELDQYALTEATTRVLQKAFALSRSR